MMMYFTPAREVQGFEALALEILPLPHRQSEEAVQRAAGDEEARHTGLRSNKKSPRTSWLKTEFPKYQNHHA